MFDTQPIPVTQADVQAAYRISKEAGENMSWQLKQYQAWKHANYVDNLPGANLQTEQDEIDDIQS